MKNKFRGRRVDNGEWVYGLPVTYFGKTYILVFNSFEEDRVYEQYPHKEMWSCEVIPETVGQFTGLRDENGKEIYEGDICNCEEYECFGKVEWNDDEAGFFFCVIIEGGGFEEEQLYEYADELEIIGNIYENPELMEDINND